MKKPIECKSELGVTIGLIDSLITIARVLYTRLDYDAMSIGSRGDKYQPIRSALTDLCTSELRTVMGLHDESAMKLIHDAARLIETKAA